MRRNVRLRPLFTLFFILCVPTILNTVGEATNTSGGRSHCERWCCTEYRKVGIEELFVAYVNAVSLSFHSFIEIESNLIMGNMTCFERAKCTMYRSFRFTQNLLDMRAIAYYVINTIVFSKKNPI